MACYTTITPFCKSLEWRKMAPAFSSRCHFCVWEHWRIMNPLMVSERLRLSAALLLTKNKGRDPEGRRKSWYVPIRRHRWAGREWKGFSLRVCTAFRTLPYDEADWTVNFQFAIRKAETSWFYEKFQAFSFDGFPAKTAPYANFTPNDAGFCAEQKERCSRLAQSWSVWWIGVAL